jgi:DnaK suppressor protein
MKTDPQRIRQNRYDELKMILEEHRLAIVGELQNKMRDLRNEDTAISRLDVRDDAENSETQTQDDIDLALLQMKTEILKKIARALTCLNEGSYGYCSECQAELTEERLRALPFALRCKQCEEMREVTCQQEMLASRVGVSLPSSGTVG